MNHTALASILRINRHRVRQITAALQPYDYVGTMHLILLYLNRCPGASQDDVSAFYAIDKGSIARDARRLEERDHIRREIDPDNRRQYKLYLTDRGRDVLNVVLDVNDSFYLRMTQGLSSREAASLERLLARVEKNVCEDL